MVGGMSNLPPGVSQFDIDHFYHQTTTCPECGTYCNAEDLEEGCEECGFTVDPDDGDWESMAQDDDWGEWAQ